MMSEARCRAVCPPMRPTCGPRMVVPPIKIYERGKINEAVFKIISRNSRLSEHLRGDLDAEIGAARLGSQRIVALAERYSVETLETAYDTIIKNCAETIRRELLPKIRDGVYAWRRLHRGRRRRRAADAHAAPDHDQDRRQDRARLHGHLKGGEGTDQLADRLRGGKIRGANGWGRCFARSRLRPSGRPKST